MGDLEGPLAGSLVERVARAIAWLELTEEERQHAGSPDDMWLSDDRFDQARAAIEAMRTPTDAMLDAGGAAMTKPGGLRGQWDVWHAMVSAALSSSEAGG